MTTEPDCAVEAKTLIRNDNKQYINERRTLLHEDRFIFNKDKDKREAESQSRYVTATSNRNLQSICIDMKHVLWQ